jgi:two-component system nitrogen regulation response regulator GlnG
LSTDSDLQDQLKRDLKEASVVVSKDVESVPRGGKRTFDGVILEMRRGGSELTDVQKFVDPLHTFILAGSRSLLSQAGCMMSALAHSRNGGGTGICLEDYIEAKLAEFVKGMKSSAARNLHPMLISAVERPLITMALRETKGNQIQAAHLLGMNRNTLRKKIAELRVPLPRARGRKSKPAKGG